MRTQLQLFLLTVAAFVAGASSAPAGNVFAGRTYARQACAECHSVEPTKEVEPLIDVPSFYVIAQMPGVLSVAQVGNLLRVLCDDGRTAADRLREALRAQGLEARIEAGTPNLEDVFVAATRRTPPAQEKPS